MPIYKRCSRCGQRIVSGSTCPCLKKRHVEYDKYCRDKESKKTYDGKKWKKARDEALRLDGGIDVYLYMSEGQIVIADSVHHIIPIKEDRSRTYDIDNLMSLHHDTHSMIEQKYKKDKTSIQAKLTTMLREYRNGRDRGGQKSLEKNTADRTSSFPYTKFRKQIKSW